MSLTEEKIKEMVTKIEKNAPTFKMSSVNEFSNFCKQQADLMKSKNKVTEALKGVSATSVWLDEPSAMQPESMSAQAKFYKMNTLGKIVMSNPMDPTEWTATSRYEKVNTMSNDIGLGRELKKDRPRDAVHIACIPVTLGEWMQPGVPVVVRKGEAFAAHEKKEKAVGVIDPFLPGGCPKGARVWLMLNPGSITSLRHDWTHPTLNGDWELDEKLIKKSPKPQSATFPIPAPTLSIGAEYDDAVKRLKKMAAAIGWSYSKLLSAGVDGWKHGHGSAGSDDTASEYLNAHIDEFWECWSVVTDNPKPKEVYFSCAC